MAITLKDIEEAAVYDRTRRYCGAYLLVEHTQTGKRYRLAEERVAVACQRIAILPDGYRLVEDATDSEGYLKPQYWSLPKLQVPPPTKRWSLWNYRPTDQQRDFFLNPPKYEQYQKLSDRVTELEKALGMARGYVLLAEPKGNGILRRIDRLLGL